MQPGDPSLTQALLLVCKPCSSFQTKNLPRLSDLQIQACWELVHQRSEFERRFREVEAFNAGSRFRKRGISLIPTKFGISFTAKFLNQVQPGSPHSAAGTGATVEIQVLKPM